MPLACTYRYFITTSLLLLMLCGVWVAYGQSAEARESSLRSQYGFEKLQNLDWLARYHTDRDLKKAHRLARQGDQLANNLARSELTLGIEQKRLLAKMKEAYGIVQYKRGKYVEAQEAFEEALSYDPKKTGITAISAVLYLQKIDSLAEIGEVKDNPFKSIVRDLDIGAAINNSKTDMAISTELQVAKMAEKRGDTASAIFHYQKAANLLRNSRDIEQAEAVEAKIATFREMRSFLVETQLPTAGDTTQKVELPPVAVLEKDTMILEGAKYSLAEKPDEQIKMPPNYYQAYLSLQTKTQEDSLVQLIMMEQARDEMERLQQENEIADLNIAAIQMEKQAEAQQKRALMVIAGGIVVGTLVMLFLYITKRRKHQKLTAAYEALDTAKRELEAAERRISRMLEQQVSPEIASALLDDRAERKRHKVTIMFLDIRDFTPMASQMEPATLIDYQNKVFGFMIDIINECHGNINQFMGDGFMATFGAPKSYGNDAANAVMAARRILQVLEEVNASGEIPHTKVGIGLHTGEVVTGNVGTDHRKQFSVTGETVIIAARVEQLNKRYDTSMIMTQEVANHLEDLQESAYEPLDVTVKGMSEPISILLLRNKKALSLSANPK